jgi:hypothetical protein
MTELGEKINQLNSLVLDVQLAGMFNKAEKAELVLDAVVSTFATMAARLEVLEFNQKNGVRNG